MAPAEIHGGGERSGRQACAACKHQRKKCENDCVFASLFPSDQNDKFLAVLNLFGVRNMKKMLNEIPSQLRNETAASLSWEANSWKQDPIHGPLGFYKTLTNENLKLKQENDQLKEAIKHTNRPGEFRDDTVRFQGPHQGQQRISGFGMDLLNYNYAPCWDGQVLSAVGGGPLLGGQNGESMLWPASSVLGQVRPTNQAGYYGPPSNGATMQRKR